MAEEPSKLTKMALAAREEYDDSDDDEKRERIGLFLDESISASIPCPLKKNSYLLYGKFDPINRDEFGNKIFERLNNGKRLPFKNPPRLLKTIEEASTDKLLNSLSKIKPCFHKQVSIQRLAFYLINSRLTQLGVAPRWRKMGTPAYRPHGNWSDGELRYLRDMQVFDMEWLYQKYPKHRVKTRFGGVFNKLHTGESFDFGLASVIAAADLKSETKAKYFNLNQDMMAEMSIIRNRSIEKQHKILLSKLEEVESDLIMAASRNPRRGNKLLDVLDNWLKIFQSVMMTEGLSEKRMIDNYEKLSGKKINRSTFRAKLTSINDALKEVDSKHAF